MGLAGLLLEVHGAGLTVGCKVGCPLPPCSGPLVRWGLVGTGLDQAPKKGEARLEVGRLDRRLNRSTALAGGKGGEPGRGGGMGGGLKFESGSGFGDW